MERDAHSVGHRGSLREDSGARIGLRRGLGAGGSTELVDRRSDDLPPLDADDTDLAARTDRPGEEPVRDAGVERFPDVGALATGSAAGG